MDDALLSCPSEGAAVDLMKRTQLALKAGGKLRLHKITSNSKLVLSEFPLDDLAKELKDFNLLSENDLPVQRSLGLSWDINADTRFQDTLRSEALHSPWSSINHQ